MARIFEIHDAAFTVNHVPVLGEGAKKWFVPEGEILGAYLEDGTMVGFICVIGDPKKFEVTYSDIQPCIDDLFVHPSYQGLGIGKTLMNSAEQLLMDQGHTSCCLACLHIYTPNHGFYQHLGWIQVKERNFTCETDG